MASASDKCEPCWTDAEDPLFMLYTRYSNFFPSHSPCIGEYICSMHWMKQDCRDNRIT